MIDNITAVSILWEEEARAERLITTLTSHFDHVVVVVQKGSDATAAIAARLLTRPTDRFVEDEWRGAGDYSAQLALDNVTTPWTFLVSGDELPSTELLASLPSAVRIMEQQMKDGAFLEFKETIEGLPYLEHGRHVRLFRTEGGWEPRMHSAAPHGNNIVWATGYIAHDRSLDEVAHDYLRYLTIAERDKDAGLLQVNRTMLYRACSLVAASMGWQWVWAHDWWPEVERRVFNLMPSKLADVI